MKRKMLISRAGLARTLRCSRSTISQMVDRGLPCEDGQLDRTAALQWIVDSTSGSGGGWDADHGRVSLRERALAILAGPARRGRRKAKRTAEEAVLPPATSAEFDRGA